MISEKEEERNIGKWKRSSRKVSINSINSIINFRIKKGKKEEILKTGIINLGNLESEKEWSQKKEKEENGSVPFFAFLEKSIDHRLIIIIINSKSRIFRKKERKKEKKEEILENGIFEISNLESEKRWSRKKEKEEILENGSVLFFAFLEKSIN